LWFCCSGYSSGTAIKVIQEVAAEKTTKEYDIDWAGISADEVFQGNQPIWVFLICLGLCIWF
jgi:HAE1 family hydrophobic/amphiphilic exporter-1